MDGIELYARESLMILVSMVMPWFPRCLRCRAVSLSGPTALDEFILVIAMDTSAGVKVMGSPFRD